MRRSAVKTGSPGRRVGLALALSFVTLGTLACEQLAQGLGGEQGGGGDAGPTADASVAESGVVGAGCGVDPETGVTLCVATSMCPDLVVDVQAMPSCGFRVRGSIVDLVCGCGTAICPMGAFSTCAEAAQLLANQTEQGVCVQLAEGLCFESTGAASSSSSSSSSSGGNPACDRQCVRECGGGAACAAVCNCD